MANALYDLVGMTTATVGIGSVTLLVAVQGMITFAAAGVPSGTVVSYSIREGANSEAGQGTYTAIGTSLSRDVVYESTNGGAKIVLGGTAVVYIAGLAEDFHQPVTLAVNHGLGLAGQVLGMGTPDTLTAATINAVTLTTHTHAVTGFQPTLVTGNMTATSPIAVDQTRQVIGGAVVLSHEATAGNIHLPLAGVVNQILKNSGVAGTGAWGTVTENAGALAAITTINMSSQLTSTLAIGTAPFVVTSTFLNTNLNADLLDGQHGAYYAISGGEVILAPASSVRNVIQPTGNFIPLTIKGNAAQAVNLQEWQNSGGTSLLAVNAAGDLIGTYGSLLFNVFSSGVYLKAASGKYTGLLSSGSVVKIYYDDNANVVNLALPVMINSTSTTGMVNINNNYLNATRPNLLSLVSTISVVAGSASLFGGISTIITIAGANNYTGNIYAGTFQAMHTGTAIATSVMGVNGLVDNAAAGTITAAYGLNYRVINTATGTITTAYGINIGDCGNSGGGTVVNVYGLYLGNQSVGTTLNYALYTNAGLNRLGDQLSVIGSADRIQLIVKGNATQTANLQEWQNSGGTVLASLGGVAGILTLIGSTTTDLPTYSAEFLPGTGWTSTDWTGSFAAGWAHPVGTIETISLGSGGSGYTALDVLTVVQAGGSLGTVRVDTVDGSGTILTVTRIAKGSGYAVANGLAVTGGTGTLATINILTINNASVLSQSTAAVNATRYQIAYTVTGRTAGSFTISFGGQSLAAITATGAFGPTTTSTANLTITPTATFDGTIVISIKSITAVSTPLVNLKSSDGTARIEMRVNTATGNTFIGIVAGRYNTTGYNNSAQGAYALYSNTTGYNNSAQGAYALQYNTTGYYNSAQGVNALYYNTTGYYNSAQGLNALYSNTTGYYNSAQGAYALYSLRPTSKAITAFADYSGTVAGTVKATSVGHGLAGTSTKMISGTTDYNGSKSITVIDPDNFYFTATWTSTQTGWWAIDSEGRYNTAVGVNAGRTLITGDSNTFLGYSAGYNASQLTSATNSMAFGNGAYTTLSNTVVIGNTSVVGVGIGTYAPGAHLDLTGISDVIQLKVKGNATQTANLQEWQKSTAAVQISFDDNGGAVFNEAGNAAADHRIESDTEANMVFLDASADTISFGGTGAASSTVAKGGAVTSPKTTTNDVNFPSYSPAALAGDVDNWDLGANTFIRATGGAGDRIVTGIVARGDGHLLIIQNIGATNKLSFPNESGSSTAANRIINANAGTTEIAPNHTIMYIYDATTARWREVTHL